MRRFAFQNSQKHSRGMFCPRFALTSRSPKAGTQGKPDASCTRSPVYNKVEKVHELHSPQGSTDIRFSLLDAPAARDAVSVGRIPICVGTIREAPFPDQNKFLLH
jgi:hypothetical protein